VFSRSAYAAEDQEVQRLKVVTGEGLEQIQYGRNQFGDLYHSDRVPGHIPRRVRKYRQIAGVVSATLSA
jgi:hypothetical protein